MYFVILVLLVVILLVGVVFYMHQRHKERPFVPDKSKYAEIDGLPCGQILSSFNFRNRSERDYRLSYSKELNSYCCEETELHYINEIIDRFFPQFDVVSHSRRVSQRSGEDVVLIREKWDATTEEARRVGQFLQRQITNILVGRNYNVNYKHVYMGKMYRCSQFVSIIPEINQFQQFRQQLSGSPYRSDWLIFDNATGIVATVDLLQQEEDGKFHLYEWTRSRKMGIEHDGNYELRDSEDNSFGKAPLEHVPDTQFHRISLKMNFLRFILAQHYNIQVDIMTLVVFHASLHSFHTLLVPLMEAEVEAVNNLLLKKV